MNPIINAVYNGATITAIPIPKKTEDAADIKFEYFSPIACDIDPK